MSIEKRIPKNLVFFLVLNLCLVTLSLIGSLNLKLYYYPEHENYTLPDLKTVTDDETLLLIDDESEYISWLRSHRNSSLYFTRPLVLHYRATAGLGHQLVRLSAAYHLGTLYKLPYLYPTANPVCQGSDGIFAIYDYLIGPGQLILDVPAKFAPFQRDLYQRQDLFALVANRFPNLTKVDEAQLPKDQVETFKRSVSFNNEVAGYQKAQFGWYSPNFTQDLQQYTLDLEQNELFSKDLTDYQLYHQLMLLFEDKHGERIRAVLDQTRFVQHTVFGLHVRAGNGEGGDFLYKRRSIFKLDKWIKTVMEMLCRYSDNNQHLFQDKPLMIFVGTDTGSVVQKLQKASHFHCKIPVVSAEQAYPEEGKSVSFLQSYKNASSCYKSWESMFLDMYMFTRCHSVISGSYSSFTQSAPFSFVMHKAQSRPDNNHLFCEFGTRATRLDCFNSTIGWLKRDPAFVLGSGEPQRIMIELMFPSKSGFASVSKFFQGTVMKESSVVSVKV